MFFVKAEAGGESEPACNIHFQKSVPMFYRDQNLSDKKPTVLCQAVAAGRKATSFQYSFPKISLCQTVNDKKTNCSLPSCSGWAKGSQLSIFISKNQSVSNSER